MDKEAIKTAIKAEIAKRREKGASLSAEGAGHVLRDVGKTSVVVGRTVGSFLQRAAKDFWKGLAIDKPVTQKEESEEHTEEQAAAEESPAEEEAPEPEELPANNAPEHYACARCGQATLLEDLADGVCPTCKDLRQP